MKKIIPFLFLVFLSPYCAYSQERVFLGGVLKEKAKGSPIPYATIKLWSSTQSTLSNNEGTFTLDISNALDGDTILFTCIGYKPLKVPVKMGIDQSTRQFTMEPNVTSLKEVVIHPFQLSSILNEAVKVSVSRYAAPAVLKGYYRESVKRDSFLTKYADGLVEYFVGRKSGQDPKIDLRVDQSRVKELPLPDEQEKFNEFNSPISVQKIMDYISPCQISVLDSNQFKFYTYDLEEIVQDGREVYQINFNPIENSSEALYRGKIFIDKKTQLIMAVEYNVDPNSEKYLKTISLLGVKVSLLAKQFAIRYHLSNNIYSPFFIRQSFTSQITSKRINQKNEFTSELIITDLDLNNSQSFKNDTYTKRSLYKRGNQYSFEFWKDPKLSPNTPQEASFLKN